MGSGVQEFFISRAGEDKEFAIVIDKILREAGHKTFVQDNDFGHTSFMARMTEGFRKVDAGARIVALLSRRYQQKEHCLKEAHYPLTDDPQNIRQRLIVLRIEECAPQGFLKDIPYIDLVPLLLDADLLGRAVRGAVAPDQDRRAADFATLYQRSPKQILHPEIRAVAGFVSRDGEIEALDEALWKKSGRAALTNSQSSSAAVKGMGGVGKSVLAQEYAWRNRDRYQGVWWVRAEQTETLLDDLIELGSRFIDGLKEVPDRAQAAQATLTHIAQTQWAKPWLIVYDNVPEPSSIDKLTPADMAHVLITTRWSDWYGHAEELPVDVFPRQTAIEYLMERARRADTEAAGRLADDLGCLPLALSHARSYCWGMNWGFDDYRAKLPELIKKAPRGAAYPEAVFATFELALGKAIDQCAEAETLMGICAFLAPDRIPLDIFTEDVMSEIERGEAVAALAEVSLLTLETLEDGSVGVSVHRLVQEVMRGRLADDAEDAARLALMQVAAAYPFDSDDVRYWPTCHKLEAHVLAVLQSAPDEGEYAIRTSRICNQYGLHLKARGDFLGAEPHYRRALQINEATFGESHPMVATALSNIAGVLQLTARQDEAEPLYRRAIAIDEAAYGADHPEVAIDLNNLAGLLRQTARTAEAEPLLRRSLEIFERTYGPEHPSVATNINNLAGLLWATGRADEAEPLYRRAIQIDVATYGDNHPEVATDINNLAGLLQEKGDFEAALALLRHALEIFEASFGPDHPDTELARKNLSMLLSNMQNIKQEKSERAHSENSSADHKRSIWQRIFGRR
ncbi:MAG: hypothetical protein RLZ98_958 [Pseudomonadota bacterium]|jgi:tetratricopeptide (TPR) repeat protein